MRIFVQDQGMRKNNRGIWLISESRKLAYLRGLFFSHNAEIGQKDHLWMDTIYEAVRRCPFSLHLTTYEIFCSICLSRFLMLLIIFSCLLW